LSADRAFGVIGQKIEFYVARSIMERFAAHFPVRHSFLPVAESSAEAIAVMTSRQVHEGNWAEYRALHLVLDR